MDILPLNASTQRCSIYSAKTRQWTSCDTVSDATQLFADINIESMSRSEATLLGILNCTIIFISIIPYTLILVILSRGREYSSDSYRIIFHLGIADCIQLLMQLPASVWHVIGGKDFYFVGNKVFGSVLNAGWIAYITLTLLLAINRLFTIIGGAKADEYFVNRFLTYFLAICWFWGFTFFIAYLTPHLQIVYSPSSMIWLYEGSEPVHTITRKLAIYSVLIEIVLTALAYIVICCYLCYGSHCDRKLLLKNNAKKGSRRKRELRILLQAILIAGFAMLVLIYWNFYWVLISGTKWVLYIANLLWILNDGVNPAVYLALNSSIRRRVFSVVLRSSCSDSTDASSSAGAQGVTLLSTMANQPMIPATYEQQPHRSVCYGEISEAMMMAANGSGGMDGLKEPPWRRFSG